MAVVVNGPLMEQITDRLLAIQGEESFDLRLPQKQLAEAEKGIENTLNAIETVQGSLGRAAAFTLGSYGHFTERMKQDSAAHMENFTKGVLNL